LTDALATDLPELTLHGISAGLHAYAQLRPGADDRAFTAAAAEVGVGVLPVTPMRWTPGPPAIVIGFAQHPPERLADVARRLAKIIQRFGR
jgi:GntR family transcriptional regulator/MocR family aminotransferase